MFNIDRKYMNYCFQRASDEGQHSIHCKSHDKVLTYLENTYNFKRTQSHIKTNNGKVFEVKLSAQMNEPTTYVTLIALQ